MSPRRLPRSVRVRLTLWYAGSLAVILALYAGGVFVFIRQSLFTELDRRLHEDFEVAEEMLERTGDGALRWRAGEHHGHDDIEERGGVEVFDLDGRLLYASESIRKACPETTAITLPLERLGYDSSRLPDGSRIRVLSERHAIGGAPAMIRAIRSEARLRRELREVLLVLGFGLPLAVSISGIGGYALARRALAPVGRMSSQARNITAERLGERLPVDNPGDELGQLAMVFNETFARLEKSFEQLRRFTADASHELRTPLTAIRSVGEVGLGEVRDPKSYREIIGSMLEEADRLARLVDSLLVISRADSGHIKLNREPVELAEVGREVASYLGPLAEEKRQTITVESAGAVRVTADRLVLRQAVVNLVDNAIKHGPEGCPVRIRVLGGEREVSLEVMDRGPGIPPDHQERIFDRFYRIDRGRSRDLGGCGLGLSIARWAVEAHGGRIELESREDEGSTFRIVLPLPAASGA